MKTVVFIIGPTAVSKTAVSLSLAHKIDAEIVSCDSMQIYKELNIVSSKPSIAERRKIKHYMIHSLSINKNFNVADYFKYARKAIEQIHSKDKVPLVVGGSGLYMSVLLDGIFTREIKNSKVRDNIYEEARQKGCLDLYKELKNIDLAAAKKIHPNDLRRIVRALEVYRVTGLPISKLQKKRKGIIDKYQVLIFGLNRDREELYNIINNRVETMFRQGAVAEIKKLSNRRLSKTASQLIGVKEIRAYLKGEITKEQAKEILKQNTRRLVKRQLTWFRKDKRFIWIDIGSKEKISSVVSKIKKELRGKIK